MEPSNLEILKSKYVKIILLIICILYVVSPFDLINDFFPIGRLDDIIVFVIGGFLAYFLKKQIDNEPFEKLRNAFKNDYPEIDNKYSELQNSIGYDNNYKLYRDEAANVFKEILKVYYNTIKADKRIDNFAKLRKNLLQTIEKNDGSERAKEGAERSKQLITRIDNESELLAKYIVNAQNEIKATELDFIHTTTEIELAKASGQTIDLAKLSSRIKSLRFIASNLPSTVSLLED